MTRSLKDGPKKTIDRLLAGEKESDDYAATSAFLTSEATLPASAPTTQLAAAWVHRCLHSPHPLREKLSLFWHNHFATSNAKVQNARLMYGQYERIHRHALGDFRELLQAMTLDPAMLVWLDGNTSVKGKPNENYARELMELFSLGIGHYTEADIREAARAFTGYDIDKGAAKFDSAKHDGGKKTVLGKTGSWKAEEIVAICLGQEACAKFIATKLYRFLVSETAPPSEEVVDALAAQYRKSAFDTGKLVGTILRSRLFFSADAYRHRVKSPVDFLVGTVRALEGRAGAGRLAESLETLGQLLFAPPSVKGWDGGPAWLNAQTLLARQNLALALTSSTDERFRGCDPAKLFDAKTDAEAVDFFLDLFLQGDVPAASRTQLLDYLKASKTAKTPGYWTADEAANHRIRTLAHLMLAIPEYQLD